MHEKRFVPRVLVADDEKLISDTLVTILKMHGFDAYAAYSGESAVERANNLSPDILVSDIRMCPMDGIEAAMRVHAMQPSCRIVLLSGAAMDSPRWSAIREHGFEYLDKPIPPEILVEHLKSGSGEALRSF